MGKYFIFIWIFVCSLINIFICKLNAQIKIEVIYPKEGGQIIAADSTFIFGNVSPVSAKFVINDKPVSLYPNGAFLAMIPVKPGPFSFVCEARVDRDTTQLRRNVYIPYYLKTSPEDPLTIDTSYVFPLEVWELQRGEKFRVAFKGSPDCKASFTIEGLVKDLPMLPLSPQKLFSWSEGDFGDITYRQMKEVKGIYVGTYIIRGWEGAKQRKISFKLKNDAGKVVETIAPGRLTVSDAVKPGIVEFNNEVIIARAGKRSNYQYFFPAGMRTRITGRRGNTIKVRLTEKEDIWIKDENITLLPGTPLFASCQSRNIQMEDFEKKARVKVFFDQKLPFKVEQFIKPPSLTITFYGLTFNNPAGRLVFDHVLIQEIQWENTAELLSQIIISLKNDQQWGYHPFYEENTFCLDIKKKPNFARSPFSPLKDLVICLDPGHSPDLGAIGPMGVIEKNVNYWYCSALKQKLEPKGAFVILTRGENDGAALSTRVQTAIFMDADILLSIHFNALPDGVDPFENRGISTYYFHPQSHRLAHWIQKMLLKYTSLPNFGLYSNNLTILRVTQMITVLTEPGFIMHPWEEILIVSESYREKVVNAIVEGMEQFLRENQ